MQSALVSELAGRLVSEIHPLLRLVWIGSLIWSIIRYEHACKKEEVAGNQASLLHVLACILLLTVH